MHPDCRPQVTTEEASLGGSTIVTDDYREPAAPASAWFALAVLIVATLFGFVDRQVISLLAEPIKHALSLSDSQLGIVQGLGFAVFTTVLVFPLSLLADRYDRRIVLALCVLIWASATAACGLAHNFTQLFLATIGIAAGETGLSPIIYSTLPDLFPYRQRVTANFIFYVAAILGVASGLGFGGMAIGLLNSQHAHLPLWLQTWETWRLAFFVVALPAPLLVFLICFLRLPRGETRNLASAFEEPAPDFLPYLRSQFRTIASVYSSIGVYTFAFGAAFAWMPIVLVRFYGLTPASSGIALGLLIGLGSLSGILIAGVTMRFIVPKYGKLAPLRIGRISMLFALVPGLFLIAAREPWQAYILVAIQTVAGVAAGSLAPNLIQDLSPPRLRGRLSAIYAMITVPIGGASGILVGVVSDLLHRESRALILAIVIVGTPAWLLAYFLMRQAERPFLRTLQFLSTTSAEQVNTKES